MTNVADILNVLAAAGGLGVLLVMAVVPLLVDRHGPRDRPEPGRPVAVPAQRGAEPADPSGQHPTAAATTLTCCSH